ncbi:MAG: penicillin-binding protein 2 [Bacteroidota bacterium]
MNTGHESRRFVLNTVFIVVIIIFTARLFYLQIIESEYKAAAYENVFRFITDYPNRGLIYDRTGKLLVYNEASYDLMVTPTHMENIDTNELCKILSIEKIVFKERIARAKAYSFNKSSIFQKRIDEKMYGVIQEKLYKFPGFFVQARTQRRYPQPIGAHFLGYIGEANDKILEKDKYYEPGDNVGITGIEKSYEKFLRGKKGHRIVLVDVLNREQGRFQNGAYDTAAIAGDDVWSSIDMELQAYGEKLMNLKKGSIVAIEPSSGEILCLISSPTYDPNLLADEQRTKNFIALMKDTIKPLFNRALLARYPPGSTFKLANALVAQELGVVNPGTRFPCSKGYHLGSLTIGCHSHGSPLDLRGAIQQSCNAYFCSTFINMLFKDKRSMNMAQRYDRWRDYIISLGFGKRYDDDLPSESNGLIPSSKYFDKSRGVGKWNPYNILSMSIGQGEVLATPLQMANFTAVVANRGYFFIPHIVKGIGKSKVVDKKFTDRHVSKVSKEYFNIVVQGMRDVVVSGTGRSADIREIPICGKTGTAENPHGADHSLFVAFAPMNDPKIAICVIIENAGFGATWAAPIASLMIEKYINRKVMRPGLELEMMNKNLMNVPWVPKKKKKNKH